MPRMIYHEQRYDAHRGLFVGLIINNPKDPSKENTTGNAKILKFMNTIDKYSEMRHIFDEIRKSKGDARLFKGMTILFSERFPIDFLNPMLDFFENTNALEFIEIVSGLKDPSRNLALLKQKNREYYAKRGLPKVIDVLDLLGKYCGVLKMSFDDYQKGIQDSLQSIAKLLRSLNTYIKSNPYFKDEFVSYKHENIYQSILDYLVKIDMLLFGLDNSDTSKSLNLYNGNFFRESMEFINPKPFDKGDLKYVKQGINSLFLCFYKDLQVFRLRLLGYALFSNDDSKLDDEQTFLYYEGMLKNVLLSDASHLNYFDDKMIEKIKALNPTVQIQQVHEEILKKHDTTFYFRGIDDEKTKEKILNVVEQIVKAIESKKMSKVLYKSLKRIVVTKKSLAIVNEKTHLDNVLGQYFDDTQHLVLYADQTNEQKFFLNSNFDRKKIEKEHWDRLSSSEQKAFCDYDFYVLLHELGHHLHLKLISNIARQAWEYNFWQQKSKGWGILASPFEYVSTYALENPNEDFAETFAYIMINANIHSKTPKQRFDDTMKQAKNDGFDVYVNPLDESRQTLYALTSNLISKYIGAKFLDIEQTFAFVIPEPWNKHLYFKDENSSPMLGFQKASEYVRIDHRPLYYVAIKHEFYLLDMPQKIEILLQTLVPLYCLSFIEFFGIDAFDSAIETIGISVDTHKSIADKIETISNLVMLDIEDRCEYDKHTNNKTMLFFRYIVKITYDAFIHTKAFEFEPLFDANDEIDHQELDATMVFDDSIEPYTYDLDEKTFQISYPKK